MNIYGFLRQTGIALTIIGMTACGGGYGGGSYGGGGGGYGSKPVVSITGPAVTAINLGQRVKLQWTSTYATSCTASNSGSGAGTFSGNISTNGSAMVAPTVMGSYTYTVTCTGSAGDTAATSPAIAVGPSILSTLTTTTTIGSTLDPIENGGNPYGLAIAPVSAGLITAGDLIVCNFNDGATNTQGLGTTIVGLHPTAGATPYRIAQSAQLQGCAALAMLPDDSIAAASFSANAVPLVSAAGSLTSPFTADSFTGPWSLAYAAANATQVTSLYVATQNGGAITRVTLNGDVQTGAVQIASGFCGSGAPGGVFAPAGLTYDASIDTLYIVDTSSTSVVALSNVSTIGSGGIVVNGSCGGSTPTPALTFSGASASQAAVIASGGQLNAPISAALLKNGDLVVSNGDINGPATSNLLFEISPALGFVGSPVQLDTGAPGALFGLATTVDGSGKQIIYFNDDNDNTVKMLSQ